MEKGEEDVIGWSMGDFTCELGVVAASIGLDGVRTSLRFCN